MAYMSTVSDYPAKACVYDLEIGSVDVFKCLISEMLDALGEEYTKKFMDKLKNKYKVKEEDFMLMFSAIYCIRDRTKKEKEFYGKHVENWLENDREKFEKTIWTVADQDLGRLIIKKL